MAFLFYFGRMNYVSVNGKIQDAGEQALLVSNRGYRYGDGLFETMKLADGGILLAELHFERLFSGWPG
jgi:Branched-chain amino acid aminotransferase/4-amino-4-deoxychorismate lyase